MTHEKNKSYPKPTILNMKWSNRNINVVEWAKIPKLSALDDSQTSRIILYDVLVDAILCYIKLSSRVGINFEITNENLLGTISFQTIRCNGRRPLILLC